MSDAEQNVGILKQAYVKWSQSKGASADDWAAIFADNFKFGSIAQGGHGAPYLKSYQSRDQLKQYFGGLLQDWDMLEYTTDHFIAQDDRVVMIGHCSWRNKRRQGGVDAEGGFLALRGRQGCRVLRVL